ncbi:MAG: hypothetical protein JWO37_1103 [Acidimicrobiales bacterium]|jgi:hypothetical protein|nr:hypothetical protein [Acidimicrobiales bacterium]
MTRSFAVTWDYRCPFARNAHEHLLVGLAAGAEWHVEFVPFSLNQIHVEESQPAVWENPEHEAGLLAMQVGISVRDNFPAAFPAVHRALFLARHDEGRDIRDDAVLRAILKEQDVDADAVFADIAGGRTMQVFEKAHERAVDEHGVFGVPTFIADGQAVFVRVMHGPSDDPQDSITTIERLLDLTTGWPDLNEFKHTRIPR